MDFASLWEQLQAMLQSDAPMFTIGSYVITERIAAIAGIISGILTIFSIIQIFLSIARWAFGPKEAQAEMLPTMLPTSPSATKEESELAQMAKAKQIAEDPNSIVDTSDKKRSLYDYVTPDSIHAEVLKQTLNNDYPYQVLRPGTMLPNQPQSFETMVQQPKEGSLSSVEFQLPQLPGTEKPETQSAPVIQPAVVAETVTIPQEPVPPEAPIMQPIEKQEIPKETAIPITPVAPETLAKTTEIPPEPVTPPVVSAPVIQSEEMEVVAAKVEPIITSQPEQIPNMIETPVAKVVTLPNVEKIQTEPNGSVYSPTDPLLP